MKKLLALTLAALLSGAAFAQASVDPESLSILTSLKAKYPGTQFNSVEKSPVDGLFEVVMGKNIAYTNRDGRYFFFGSIYDMQTRTDLTASKREAANRVSWDSLPMNDAFVTVRGAGTRKIAVFTDPDCPYCQKLEVELAKLDDVTIYTFLYPIDGLHPEARGKATNVWCSKDRAGSWKTLMSSGAVGAVPNCDTPIDRNLAFGESIGIQGTPFLVNAAGRSMPGFAPAEKLEAWLKEGK